MLKYFNRHNDLSSISPAVVGEKRGRTRSVRLKSRGGGQIPKILSLHGHFEA